MTITTYGVGERIFSPEMAMIGVFASCVETDYEAAVRCGNGIISKINSVVLDNFAEWSVDVYESQSSAASEFEVNVEYHSVVHAEKAIPLREAILNCGVSDICVDIKSYFEISDDARSKVLSDAFEIANKRAKLVLAAAGSASSPYPENIVVEGVDVSKSTETSDFHCQTAKITARLKVEWKCS